MTERPGRHSQNSWGGSVLSGKEPVTEKRAAPRRRVVQHSGKVQGGAVKKRANVVEIQDCPPCYVNIRVNLRIREGALY